MTTTGETSVGEPSTLEFCTYFDANYLTRGLAMYQSLRRHTGSMRMWILCLDDETHAALIQLGEDAIRPIRLADFEAGDSPLLAAKATRSKVEYYFTVTPSLPLYILRQDPSIQTVTYVDADLLFYSDPRPLLADREGRSITIIPHGFPAKLQHLAVHGTYNVGLLSFRNDPAGRTGLARWRHECLDWCYDRLEDGKFADQGYLNDWPDTLEGVAVIDRPGAGLAPWNFMRYEIDLRRNPPTADGDPLVFYHFQAFKARGRWLYDLGLAGYGKMPRRLRIPLYGGYMDALEEATTWLAKHGIHTPAGAPSGRHSHRRRILSTMAAIARGQMLLAVGPLRV